MNGNILQKVSVVSGLGVIIILFVRNPMHPVFRFYSIACHFSSPYSGKITAAKPNANKLIDGDYPHSTCVDDLDIYKGKQTWLNIEHYNETWYKDAVPIALQFKNQVTCSMIKVS